MQDQMAAFNQSMVDEDLPDPGEKIILCHPEGGGTAVAGASDLMSPKVCQQNAWRVYYSTVL
jgi:hypothetical protein